MFRVSVLASRGGGGGQNRPKTAVWACFRLFSAPKTEGPGPQLAPRHFWRPPPMRGCGIAHLEHSEHRWGGQARRIRRLCRFLAFAAQLFWPRGSNLADLGTPENGPKSVIYTVKTAIFDFGRFGAFADSASGARRFHRPAEVDLHTLRFGTTYCTCHLKLYSRFYAVGKLAVFWAPQNRPLRPWNPKL